MTTLTHDELKSEVQTVAINYVFGINNADNRARLKSDLTTLLTTLVTVGKIADFAVVCDDKLNPPELVTQGKMRVDIAVKFRSDVSFIYFPLHIASTNVGSTSINH